MNIYILIFCFQFLIDNINDVYWLAEAYYQSQQYEQALDLLNKKDTISKSVQCRYLAGLCAVSNNNDNKIQWILSFFFFLINI